MQTLEITPQRSHSPGSVYAEWTRDERDAADWAEDAFNLRTRCELAELVHTQYVRAVDDGILRDQAVRYRREIEDIEAGRLVGGAARIRVTQARLNDVLREQNHRAALAASWLATDDGTHCYTAYHARGGLDAVANHGATPPSYQLAAQLDHLNWKRGLPHVLAWKEA